MKLKDLMEELSGWDDEAEVVIRVAIGEDEDGESLGDPDFDGAHLAITDDRSFMFMEGRVIIVGDLIVEDE